MAFRLAHLKRQRQILASGGGEPLGGAHSVLPAAGLVIKWLEAALNNLALAATNDTAVLQQLTAANLALTATVGTLIVTNKKLVDVASRLRGPPAGTPVGGARPAKTPFPGNYCWTTATASARSTRVQLAPTKPLATALTPLLQIPWVAARRTRVGARRAPDGGDGECCLLQF
jgi:hypothetical protein